MNDARRKKLVIIVSELGTLIDEEQDTLDNSPESIQDSEKGEAMGNCVAVMETAKDDLEELTF